MSDYEAKCKNSLPIIFDDRMPVNNLTPKLVNRVNNNTEDLKNLYGETEAIEEDVTGKLDAPETTGTAGQVLTSDGEGGAVWAAVGSGEIVVDPTLTIQGAAADAKKTGDEISLLKQDNDELESKQGYNILAYNSDYVSGKYVRYDTGAVDIGSGWKYTEIPVYEGEVFTYNYTRETPDMRGLAFYNASGGFISGVQAIATPQIITVPANAVLCRASFEGGYDYDKVFLKSNIFDLKNDINSANQNGVNALSEIDVIKTDLFSPVSIENFNTLENSYIRADGSVGNSSVRDVKYFMCDKNTSYVINTTSTDDNFRSALFMVAPRQNGSGYSVAENLTGTRITIKTDDTAVYVAFSVLKTDTNFSVTAYIPATDYILSGLNPLYAFDNITCIGDSLTHGVVTTNSQGGYRIAKNPYPAVLGRITGATMEEIAHGGYSASDWWDAYADSIISKNNQLAIVFLGTNGGLTDTVSTDCSGDDYNTFADTNTGNYGKIVGKLKSVGAKIILVQCFTTEGTLTATNKAIKDIADKFGCGLIATKRLLNPAYHYYPDLSGSDSLHFNDLGYSAFADFIVQQISFMDSDYLKRIIPD